MNQNRAMYMENPFAVTYSPFDTDNPNYDPEWVTDIEKLDQVFLAAGIPYEKVIRKSITYLIKEASFEVMKLSDYNKLAQAHRAQVISALKDDEAVAVFHVNELTKLEKSQPLTKEKIDQMRSAKMLTSDAGTFRIVDDSENINVASGDNYRVRGDYGTIVVSDTSYDQLKETLFTKQKASEHRKLLYLVPEWSHPLHLPKENDPSR